MDNYWSSRGLYYSVEYSPGQERRTLMITKTRIMHGQDALCVCMETKSTLNFFVMAKGVQISKVS